jgi:hypothetical protein
MPFSATVKRATMGSKLFESGGEYLHITEQPLFVSAAIGILAHHDNFSLFIHRPAIPDRITKQIRLFEPLGPVPCICSQQSCVH